MLIAHKAVVTKGFMVPDPEIIGAPFLWCNYGNIWLIILEDIGSTCGIRKRETGLEVVENPVIYL